MVEQLIQGARGNSFGRRVNIQYDGPGKVAHVQGRSAALRKFALYEGEAQKGRTPYEEGRAVALAKFANMGDHLWEVGGLAPLMGIQGYELYEDFKHQRPLKDKIIHGTELAGLTALGVPSLMHLLKR